MTPASLICAGVSMSRMIVFRVEVNMHKLCDFKVTALRSHIPVITALGNREI